MTHDDDRSLVPGFDRMTVIGHGGSAAVYSAIRSVDGTPVAVKVFDAGESGAARRQVAALERLTDVDGILQLDGHGTIADGRSYTVSPFCPGGSLADRMARFGAIPGTEVAQIGHSLATALAAAHRAGVLHRDIKPSNVLFGADGAALLSDFGAATITDVATASETMAVTVLYAAPEVLEGSDAGELSDVYSLGLTLLSAAIGHHPFRTDGDPAIGTIVQRICSEGIPDPSQLGLPVGLSAVLACATARSAEDRYQSAERFADAVAQVVDEPDRVPDGTTTRRRRTSRRRGRLVASVAVVAALAIGGAGWVFLRDEPPADAGLGEPVTERNGILGPLYEQSYARYVGLLEPGCQDGQNLVELAIHAGPADFERKVETPWDAVDGEGAGTFMSYMPCDTGIDQARYLLGATGRWFVVAAEFPDDQYERMSEWMRENENSPSPDFTVDDPIRATLADPEAYKGWAIIDQEAE